MQPATPGNQLDRRVLIERMNEEKVQNICAGRHKIVDVVEHADGSNFTIRETERPENSVTLSRSMIPVLLKLLKPLAK